MDAARRVNGLNNGGSVLVLVAVSLGVLILVAGLVIDLGYMYVNKAQLQKAADAGALAGAGRLSKQPLANLTGARNGAVHITDTNFNLTLSTNSSNDPGGDVVIGNWNPANTPKFNPTPPSGTTLNAVKVVARRTGDTGAGIGGNTPFNLFLGKVAGIDTMGAAAAAVAWRPPRARTYFMIGIDVCTGPLPATLSPAPGFKNLAWTSLLDPSTNASDVQNNFFCPANKLPFIDVCGKQVYTTGGTVSSVFKSVEVDFYDLNYDAGMKTFSGTGASRQVTSWRVIVPVSAESDPTTQPVPHTVWGYAEILITRACGSGGGSACPGRTITAPGGICSGGENDIVIDSITCTSCGDYSDLGAQPVLAQ